MGVDDLYLAFSARLLPLLKWGRRRKLCSVPNLEDQYECCTVEIGNIGFLAADPRSDR
jgi:hypothetical protein